MRKIIEGNVKLSSLHLTELLDLSDVEIGGSFRCNENNLTSLEGIPKTVGFNLFISKPLKDKFPEEYIRGLCEIKGGLIYF